MVNYELITLYSGKKTADKAGIPDIRKHEGAFRDEISVVHLIGGCTVWQTARDWAVPSEELLDKRIEVRKGRYVIKSRKAVWSDYGVEFALRLALYPRIQRHQDDKGLHHCVGLCASADGKIWSTGRK